MLVIGGIDDITGVDGAGVAGDEGVLDIGATGVEDGVDTGVEEDEQPARVKETIVKARTINPIQILNGFFMYSPFI